MFDPDTSYRYYPLDKKKTNIDFNDDRFSQSNLYKFKCSNKNPYHIIVEEYMDKYIFIKFYPSIYQHEPDKFKVRTNKQDDFSRIIATCVKLTRELIIKHPEHTFGFFGQWDNIDIEKKHDVSQRFRIYKRVVVSLFPYSKFKHMELPVLNVFLLTLNDNYNKKYARSLQSDIFEMFTKEVSESLIIPNNYN